MLLAALAALGSLMVLLAVLPVYSASPFDPVPYEPLPPDVKIETVVPSANQLVAMDFTPDGRLLYTERNTGRVRVVVNGTLLITPVFQFPVIAGASDERGLLGIAVDPNFTANHYVWVYFTKQSTTGQCSIPIENRIVRFTLGDDNQGSGETVAGCFPVDLYATIHNGGNLHFGPDGKLYVTVGNNDDVNDGVDPAQNLSSPLGKIHRFDPTVPLGLPTDNPFYYTPGAVQSIFARGLRNSFDFTFDPRGGTMFATENGDACDDEINRILPGGNYGWRPNDPCEDEWPTGPDPAYNTLPPMIFWTPSLAPTGITVYSGTAISEWQGDVFMCSYKDATTAIHHFKLNADRTAIVSHTILTNTLTHQRLKCRTDLLPGPDGALYFSEGGGWISGSIKRLIRRTSFAATSVHALPLNPPSGGSVDYTIDLQHIGTLSNTFALTVNIPPAHAFLVSAQAQQGVLNQSAYQLLWSGTVTGVEAWTATYRLQIGTDPATAYPLTHSLRLTAPGAATVILTPTVMVNGTLTYLPMLRREN
jgi:glucose/arabinose dehydrogenase